MSPGSDEHASVVTVSVARFASRRQWLAGDRIDARKHRRDRTLERVARHPGRVGSGAAEPAEAGSTTLRERSPLKTFRAALPKFLRAMSTPRWDGRDALRDDGLRLRRN
jgi:hypothetical protein